MKYEKGKDPEITMESSIEDFTDITYTPIPKDKEDIKKFLQRMRNVGFINDEEFSEYMEKVDVEDD